MELRKFQNANWKLLEASEDDCDGDSSRFRLKLVIVDFQWNLTPSQSARVAFPLVCVCSMSAVVQKAFNPTNPEHYCFVREIPSRWWPTLVSNWQIVKDISLWRLGSTWVTVTNVRQIKLKISAFDRLSKPLKYSINKSNKRWKGNAELAEFCPWLYCFPYM